MDVNSQTAGLTIKYLLQSGRSESAIAFYKRYEEAMAKISPHVTGDLSGDWVFKAIVKEKGILSETEDQFAKEGFEFAGVMNDTVIMSRRVTR